MLRAPTLKDLPPAAKTHIRPGSDKKVKKNKAKPKKKAFKVPSNLVQRRLGVLPGAANPLWEDVLYHSSAGRPILNPFTYRR
jgi:hypothetical protein